MHGAFLSLREALRAIRRNGLLSLASVGAVTASLLVLAAVMLLAYNLERAASVVEQEVAIRAFLCTPMDSDPPCLGEELDAAGKSLLLTRIRQMEGVTHVRYQSKADALQELKARFPEMAHTLQGYEGKANPLSDVIDVEVAEAEQIPAIAESIARMAGVRRVAYGEGFLDSLLRFTAAMRLIGMGLTALLLAATLLMLSNTIRLSIDARRREIGIMKLVGATNWYIQRPFVAEGTLLGTVGGLLAVALAALGYSRLTEELGQMIAFFSLVPLEQILQHLTLWIVGLGAGTGALGSIISIRRYLNV